MLTAVIYNQFRGYFRVGITTSSSPCWSGHCPTQCKQKYLEKQVISTNIVVLYRGSGSHGCFIELCRIEFVQATAGNPSSVRGAEKVSDCGGQLRALAGSPVSWSVRLSVCTIRTDCSSQVFICLPPLNSRGGQAVGDEGAATVEG